jgi:hypothetical protein
MLTVTEPGQTATSASTPFLRRVKIFIPMFIHPKTDHLIFEAFTLQDGFKVRTERLVELPGCGANALLSPVDVEPTGLGVNMHRN